MPDMLSPYHLSLHFPKGVPWLKPGQLPIIGPGAATRPEVRRLALPDRSSWTLAWGGAPLVISQNDMLDWGRLSVQSPYDGDRVMVGTVAPEDLDEEVFDAEIVDSWKWAIHSPTTTTIATRPSHSQKHDGLMAFRRELIIEQERIVYQIDPSLMFMAGPETGYAALIACFRRQVTCDLEYLAAAMADSGTMGEVECHVYGDPERPDADLTKEIRALVDSCQDRIFGPDAEYAPSNLDWHGLQLDPLFLPTRLVFDDPVWLSPGMPETGMN